MIELLAAFDPTELHEQAEDLAMAVRWNARLVLVLAALIVVQIVAKWVIYSRVTRLLHRVEQLLCIAERHGAITDDKVRDLKQTTTRATQAVIGVVKNAAQTIASEVPKQVAEEIKKDSNGGGNSATNLPIPSV